jgi:glycosyltransferase involved in cell wall biosynthesis
MKVLIISGSFPPMKCGVGDYSNNLAKALAAMPEVHVGVLTSIHAREESRRDAIEVFPIMQKWGILEAFKAIKVIWKWSPNIVHIQYPTQGYSDGLLPWLLPLISFLMKKKVIQTWHEGYAGRELPKLIFKLIVPGVVIVVRSQYSASLHPILRRILSWKNMVFIHSASSIPRITLKESERCNIRNNSLKSQKRLIIFFGFVYPNKGVELLFEIANPVSDQIVIIGGFDEDSEYHQRIKRLASEDAWMGKVTLTGFLSARKVAVLLSVSDAVILPFRTGGGEWNTSIHGAVLQGAFVVTTSCLRRGYDEKSNVYYAKVDDVQEMRSALDKYAGQRRDCSSEIDIDDWGQIANEHFSLYVKQ